MPRLVVPLATLVLSSLFVSRVRAQDAGMPMRSPLCPATAVGCDAQDVDFAYHDALFSAISLDSGWVPAGAPIQLHFALHVAGMTDIMMGGTAVTSWPTALTLGVPGRTRTGTLAIDYGYELTAQLRFSLDVAGTHYGWTGDIPIPGGIPRSVALMGETTFDPFVLPSDSPRPVTLTESTTRFTVFMYDAIGGFVSVPGVSGGVAVDLSGALTASYETNRIVVANAMPIVAAGATTRLLPVGSDDFGPAQDETLHPEGSLAYSGTLFFYPNLYLSIAGSRFDYTLATIPLPIVDTTANIVFPDAHVHVPLPDVGIVPNRIDFGSVDVGSAAEHLLDLENLGEAALFVHPRPLATPFIAMSDLVVPPHATERLALDFAPTTGGGAATTLFLETNDPDRPLLVIALRGDGIAPLPPDAGSPPDAALPPPDAGPRVIAMGGCCGIASASHGGPPLTVLLFSLAALGRGKRARLSRRAS